MKKITKKMVVLLLMLSVIVSMFGCSSSDKTAEAEEAKTEAKTEENAADSSEETATGIYKDILDKGEIVIAMEGTWAPWTYHDENDELVGYDVEVGKLVAEKLGVKPVFIEGEWDGLLAGLDAGRYDIMVNGVDITEERAEKYDFSVPYAFNKTAIIVADSDTAITKPEDLDGKTTANTISSTYALVAEKYGATVTPVDDLNQTFELLKAGRIDATLNAEVTFYDYVKEHPEAPVKIACLDYESTSVAIPMKKTEGSDELKAAIDNALNELAEEGKLTELSNKYFGVDISKK